MPAGSTLAGGRRGLQRPVTSALVPRLRVGAAASGRAESLDPGQPGTFVILPAGAASLLGGEAVLEQLLQRLTEAGTSAFAVVQPPPGSLIEIADSLDRSLVVLPAGSLPAEVERSVIGLLLNPVEHIRKRVEEVHERLLGMLVEDEGARLLASELQAATGKSAYVLDSFLQVLAGASEAPETEVPHVRALLAEVAASRAVSTRSLRLNLVGQLTGQSLLARPLELRGTHAGFLCLLGRPDEFGELDQRVAERAASVLAIELAKQRAIAEARLRQQGDFLDDLLEGAFPSAETLLARAQSLGYDLARPYLVFVLEATPPGDPRSATQERERFIDAVRAELLRSDSPVLVRERDGRVTVIRPAAESAGADDRSPVDALRERLSASLGGIAVAAGIGRRVEEVDQFQSAHREAAIALAVARVMFDGNRSVRFEDLGVQRLLFQLVGNPELDAYRRDLIGPLEAYDARHRSELTHTLEVFLACHGNHVRAARELHLHRNTLLYRLDRARNILGRDLDDPDTRLAVQLALKLRHVPATARLEAEALRRHNLPPVSHESNKEKTP